MKQLHETFDQSLDDEIVNCYFQQIHDETRRVMIEKFWSKTFQISNVMVPIANLLEEREPEEW